jgi:xanthine dehydrogenase molybdopterin-binding subunit B/aerobic-type carbon monoxide dehydrogenase small subunit (CoxS/CutS family)
VHKLKINLEVNGRKINKEVNSHYRLLDFLREDLDLTGSKEGCGAGECGTCSVFVDGKLVKSCLMPVAKASGKKIETIENQGTPDNLSTLQKAFYLTGASQCGFCIPGMVMAATSTLRNNPDANIEEIKEEMGGNICRCTGYQKIFDAVELARDVISGKLDPKLLEQYSKPKESYLGANVKRIDAPSKVTGRLKYAADMKMPNMLHMQVFRSTKPHAKIKKLDLTKAKQVPGVETIVTCDDVPGIDNFGVFIEDQPVLARDKVRYVGEAIAAVAADTLEAAKEAISKIEIEYEDLPALFDSEEALKDKILIHEQYKTNLVKHIPIRKGNVEEGFAKADLIVEEKFSTQAVEHAYLEPMAGVGYVDSDGTLVIVSPSQNITHHRHMMAKIMNLPIHKVRFIMSPVGGGFGGKEDMIYQGMLALCAMKTRLPVKYVMTREEDIISTAKRHPSRTTYKIGLTKEGKITAVQIKMIADGGAYGCSTEGVMRKAAILGAGPYRIDNLQMDTMGVYTNNTPSGAFRSFGALQTEFATESILDICAEKLKMDPFELRRKNMFVAGDLTHTKQKLNSASIGTVLNELETLANWEKGAPNSRGQIRKDLNSNDNRESCFLGARLNDKSRLSGGVK